MVGSGVYPSREVNRLNRDVVIRVLNRIYNESLT